MVEYVPEAGDIVWLQFNPQAGHEQAGHRPAVVLSPQNTTAAQD
jgi:mRNA interferase MazF